VFLQSVVGFFSYGALDEVGGEGGLEIASFKVFAFTQGQSSLNFLPGHFFSQDVRYSSRFLCHPTPLCG